MVWEPKRCSFFVSLAVLDSEYIVQGKAYMYIIYVCILLHMNDANI